MKKQLTKPFDEVYIAVSVLKRLGSGRIDSFEERLKSQKIQYLAQVFKISPPYPFNLYIRGPYSPQLAGDLYLFNDKITLQRFTIDELEERYKRLNELIKDKSTRDLEIISTFHWLLNEAKLFKTEAEIKLKELKHPSEGEFKMAKMIIERIEIDAV